MVTILINNYKYYAPLNYPLALLSLTACQNNEPQNTTGEVETAVERASSESTTDNLGKDKRIDGEQLSQPINEERAISATEQSIKADYQRLEALTQDKSCDSASQCKVVAGEAVLAAAQANILYIQVNQQIRSKYLR